MKTLVFLLNLLISFQLMAGIPTTDCNCPAGYDCVPNDLDNPTSWTCVSGPDDPYWDIKVSNQNNIDRNVRNINTLLGNPKLASVKTAAQLQSSANFSLAQLKKIPLDKQKQALKELQLEFKVGSIITANGQLQQIIEYTAKNTVKLRNVRTGAVIEVTPPEYFVMLCALGGPIVFAGCLTVALILVSAAAR